MRIVVYHSHAFMWIISDEIESLIIFGKWAIKIAVWMVVILDPNRGRLNVDIKRMPALNYSIRSYRQRAPFRNL